MEVPWSLQDALPAGGDAAAGEGSAGGGSAAVLAEFLFRFGFSGRLASGNVGAVVFGFGRETSYLHWHERRLNDRHPISNFPTSDYGHGY